MTLQAIHYQVDGRNLTGFLADGSAGRRVPGILVAHEGPGLNAHTKERAAMLAELGYVAFAMDLYGEVDPPLERAKLLVKSLRENFALLRLHGTTALQLLRALPQVDPIRVAAVGFCFGGTAVLELARSGADIAGVVGFHAGLSTTAPEAQRTTRCKVLVCMGADDPIITAEQRDAFATEMTAAKVDWQMIVYGGVGHSFTNRHIDSWNFPGFAYHANADRRSWQAMRNFFDEVFAVKSSAARV